MQLLYSATSPYVRKVMVLAHETGQANDIELLDCAANPVDRDPTIVAHNPVGKVPALILDDGAVLYDSRVISQYLDNRHDGKHLYPEKGANRWIVLRQEALADGLLDAALLTRYETTLRPAELRWDAWVQGQMEKIHAAIAQMEHDVAGFSDINAGFIAFGCALGYIDLRFSDLDWRSRHPSLAKWFRTFSERASMRTTSPV